MPEKKLETIKLRRLEVSNFKALDRLTIQFPPPRMSDDPDVVIMGSKNGLGKTSVLESCALLFLAATVGEALSDIKSYPNFPIDLPDLFIRAGAKKATIKGTFTINDEEFEIGLDLMKNGKVMIDGDTKPFDVFKERISMPLSGLVQRFLFSLTAINSEPLINPLFLYFHSYRKIQEGNIELGQMVNEEQRGYRMSPPFYEIPKSAFKLQILRSMMGDAKLFEKVDDEQTADVLEKINQLVNEFAGGKIGKLLLTQENNVDFRIYPIKNGGKSFSFDGLSSGQKEIISTLFLIWYKSLEIPAIILIDEPELHLNVEWHRNFVSRVFAMAPKNQYIIATHSEDIFSSVPEDRRVLLVASEDDSK